MAKGQLNEEQRARRREAARRLSADPAIVAKRAASIAKRQADPEWRARHSEICRKSKRERMKDPAFAEKLRRLGHEHGTKNLSRGLDPKVSKKAHAAQRKTMLAWCPEEFWPLNQRLKRMGYKLAERKEIILADVKGTPEHARRKIANITDAQRIRAAREAEQEY